MSYFNQLPFWGKLHWKLLKKKIIANSSAICLDLYSSLRFKNYPPSSGKKFLCLGLEIRSSVFSWTETIYHFRDAQVVGTIIRPRQKQTKKYFLYCNMTVFGFHSPNIRRKYTGCRQTKKKFWCYRDYTGGLTIVFTTLQIKLYSSAEFKKLYLFLQVCRHWHTYLFH